MTGFRLLCLAGLLSAGFAAATPAAASVRLCNETSYVLHTAAAYQRGVASKSEGWIELLPGECATALAKMPDDATAFVYARSDAAHAGEGLLFSGSERFCVGKEGDQFTIEGRRECRRRGYIEADFAPVTRSNNASNVDFTEKRDFGRRRAVMAGIQRLLTDLRYDVGTVDGFGGERTREASAAYKLRYQVKGNPKDKKLLAELIKSTRTVSRQRGLIMCNKTNHLVWAATGIVKGDSFETAGWLRIDADSCMQGVNTPLTDRYYFYYAEAVTEAGDPVMQSGRRKVWGGDFTMCTKPTRFVITGTTNCNARGFDEVKFRKIDTGSATKWQVDLE